MGRIQINIISIAKRVTKLRYYSCNMKHDVR